MKNVVRHIILLKLIFLLGACTVSQSLFEYESQVDNTGHIDSFYATELFSDKMNSEIWFSKEGSCLNVENENASVYSGNGALHLSWDKQGPECTWLGLGFGWDNWSGKNFSQVYDKSAIQFKVKANGNPIKTLPWAFALEDFGGLQAWSGFNRKMLENPIISSEEWNTVTIPIISFNWAQFEAEISNIKQLIIQFEASGDLFIDEVKIVEFHGSLNNLATIIYDPDGSQNFADFDFANASSPLSIEGNKIYLAADSKNLYFHAEIIDKSPLENSQEKSEIWNGDAIELAISTNAGSDPKRSFFLSTDHQIGFKATSSPSAWKWKENRVLETLEVKTELTSKGYALKAKIPYEELNFSGFEIGQIYGLEIAIDLGTVDGRNQQLRWNNPDDGGFYSNPSLWGEAKFVTINKQ